jgi:hypothetical protein
VNASHELSQFLQDQGSMALMDPSNVTPENALLSVKIVMMTKGVPAVRARIYRIPIRDAGLEKKWIALMPTGGKKV